jgi:hypothetical protein
LLARVIAMVAVQSQQAHFFSSTSFDENYNSFVFINIVSWQESDIFSTCVFNNILLLSFIFGTFSIPRRRHPGST